MNKAYKEWKVFDLCGEDGIFSIVSTSSGIDGNKIKGKDGNIPYITRTDKNNGIAGFVEVQDEYLLDRENVITVGLDTQTTFYQTKPFYTGQNIQILIHSNMSNDLALFFLSPIKKTLSTFNWGSNGATLKRLKRAKIMLPANEDGTPDFDYMEQYIKEYKSKALQEYISFIVKEIEPIEYKPITSLYDCNWKEFYIKDIFNYFEKGKCSNASISKSGNVPYIGATNRNNGVLDFVDVEDDKITKGNCIAFIGGGDGSAGYSIYKYEDSYVAANVICGYLEGLNKYCGLFISTCIDLSVYTDTEHNNRKYSRGNPRSQARLNRDKIMLPANEDGTPDFDYMEQYIKNIIIRKSQEYLEFIKVR